ncbi:MAG: aminodeoxychorismate/anthranilate synthase component II [Flavobacteriales bacterium]|jgi:anthranilate synthase component 2|nr:aminodeoxychorismate/anthranilate synthase component II [Flavobacteriales bacterium]MBK7248708.1 aminodeoxychorismate/anthranilate synthase component II [Flavobacteriales bacterium]MBK9059065.1 aminodeoxychorismate/anthranilate synthase component II [Flavobacteriales bacterium]QQS73947.1 MAG: aminodeoxychorismate/anthranilate synthase component II [Flavobacteriales bacterium]HQV38821.1 aminodeoxychorismate/anthranilate synthase component II [Flavobacteriales bacterium]
MRILLLDNYDSFTWNLHHLLEPLAEVDVVRNDAITVDEAARFDRIVLSPGPGLPSEAGIMPSIVRDLMATHPILGVCLGLQAIVEACGGTLFNQEMVRHGVTVPCYPEVPIDPLFAGIEAPFDVGLYHSWAADPSTLPPELQVTAYSTEGVIMALRHSRYNTCAVQFHPESVMTPAGEQLIRNWITGYSPGPLK